MLVCRLIRIPLGVLESSGFRSESHCPESHYLSRVVFGLGAPRLTWLEGGRNAVAGRYSRREHAGHGTEWRRARCDARPRVNKTHVITLCVASVITVGAGAAVALSGADHLSADQAAHALGKQWPGVRGIACGSPRSAEMGDSQWDYECRLGDLPATVLVDVNDRRILATQVVV